MSDDNRGSVAGTWYTLPNLAAEADSLDGPWVPSGTLPPPKSNGTITVTGVDYDEATGRVEVTIEGAK